LLFSVKKCKIINGQEMITLECLLEFETKEDINDILDLMRRFSSVMRYAYKRLLEDEKKKRFKKTFIKTI